MATQRVLRVTSVTRRAPLARDRLLGYVAAMSDFDRVILVALLSELARAFAGGLLIGLAASIAWIAHGRIAGVSGTIARIAKPDGGLGFRLPFVLGLVATGVAIGKIYPRAIGAQVAPGGVGTLILAGLLVGVGAQLQNGCTSGHGVCGLARNSTRSWIAVITFMAAGATTVAVVGALR